MLVAVLIGITCSYCDVCVRGQCGFKTHASVLLSAWWIQMTASCLPLTVDGGVAWHGFGGCVVVGVWTVQEGLPALALGKRGVEHQPRTRLRIHGTAAWRGAILRIKAGGERTQGSHVLLFYRSLCGCLSYLTVSISIIDEPQYPDTSDDAAQPLAVFFFFFWRETWRKRCDTLRHECLQLLDWKAATGFLQELQFTDMSFFRENRV